MFSWPLPSVTRMRDRWESGRHGTTPREVRSDHSADGRRGAIKTSRKCESPRHGTCIDVVALGKVLVASLGRRRRPWLPCSGSRDSAPYRATARLPGRQRRRGGRQPRRGRRRCRRTVRPAHRVRPALRPGLVLGHLPSRLQDGCCCGGSEDECDADPLALTEPFADHEARAETEDRDQRKERSGLGGWYLTQPGQEEPEREPVVENPGHGSGDSGGPGRCIE